MRRSPELTSGQATGTGQAGVGEPATGSRAVQPRNERDEVSSGVTRIAPGSTWGSTVGEAWRHRELLYFLVWRDLKARYRQTIVGAAWAVVQPLTLMLVFALFVGIVLHVPSDGVPYPVFAFAGILPWNFFSQSILRGSESLVGQTNLVSKVYVPRLILPVAATGSFLLDFLISFVVLGGMMLYYGLAPSADILWLPVVILLLLGTTIAVGAFLAALNVKYRDVRAAVPVLTQVWFFATPVAYPASLVPEKWRLLYDLNPMVGAVDGFRWALLETDTAPLTSMAIATAVVPLLLLLSLTYFRRVDRTFADII
jgi:lipopolysaccharide transport system permease protein